ncbi:MAG: MAG0480 family ComEC-like protein [Metamycoplasmataceae bacterium]
MKRYWEYFRHWQQNLIQVKKHYWISLNIFSIIMIIIFSVIVYLSKNYYLIIPLILFILLQIFLCAKFLIISITFFLFIFCFDVYQNNKTINNIQGNYQIVNIYNNSVIIKEKGQKILLTSSNKDQDINVGNIINIEEKIEVEKITTSSKSFDKFWLSKNIKYKTTKKPIIKIISSKTNFLEKTKSYFIRGPNFYKKYIPLILFGIKNESTKEIYEKTKSLGIVHLIVISGFHINLLFLSLTFLLSKIIKKRQKEIYFIALIFILIYLFFLGFPISALRAFLFSLGLFINKFFLKNKINNLAILSIVLLIVVLLNIYIIFDYGFIFSFILSYTIIFCLEFKNKIIIIPIITFVISSLLIIFLNEKFNYLSWLYTLIFSPIISVSYLVSLIFFPFKKFLNFYFIGIDQILNFFVNFRTILDIKIDAWLIYSSLILILSNLFLINFLKTKPKKYF